MPHKPNAEEFGKPIATTDGKTVEQIYDGYYGKYKDVPSTPGSSVNPAARLNPSPFGSAKTK